MNLVNYRDRIVDPGLTVYVVDDSKDAADSLALLLGRMGHSATACYVGEQALSLVHRKQPHCVILDIAMAGMNGLELTQRLRKDFGDDIVLVAITGQPIDDPMVEATIQVVDHHFEKPVTLDQLQKILSGSQ